MDMIANTTETITAECPLCGLVAPRRLYVHCEAGSTEPTADGCPRCGHRRARRAPVLDTDHITAWE